MAGSVASHRRNVSVGSDAFEPYRRVSEASTLAASGATLAASTAGGGSDSPLPWRATRDAAHACRTPMQSLSWADACDRPTIAPAAGAPTASQVASARERGVPDESRARA